MSEIVTLVEEEEGIFVLTLADSEGKNALSEPFIEALITSLDDLAKKNAARVGIIRGLPNVFCAGAHEDLLIGLAKGEQHAADIILPKLVLDIPIPMIAAMEGHAVGGGLALGLCCDIVLLARESRYGCSFMNLGFTPGMAITRLLERAMGEYIANEMMFGGQMIKGARLCGRTQLNDVLPKDKIWSKAIQIARRIADKPKLSLEVLKRYLSLPRRQIFEETRTVETMMHQISFAQPGITSRIQENYAMTPRKK